MDSSIALQLLKPLIRLLVRSAYTYSTISELLKRALVEVAREEIILHSPKVNSSRVSAITGLHRKDVKRLLEDSVPVQAAPPTLAMQVLSRWQSDKRFCTRSGSPKVLTMGDMRSEFSRLVALVNTDLNAGTVAFELERLGAIERTPKGCKLVDAIHYMGTEVGDGLRLLAKDIDTLERAVTENLSEPPRTRNLHLRSEYDNIYYSALPEIRRWLVAEGREFHARVREYLSKHDKDLTDKDTADPAGAKVSITTLSLTSQF